MLDNSIRDNFIKIIEEELVPAMGCTEPIALAFAAAMGRRYLSEVPQQIIAKCSGNMIKNVRCVKIPNSNGMMGIEAAAVLGALSGDAQKGMEVLAGVKEEGIVATKRFLDEKRCSVEYLDSDIPLHFIIVEKNDEDQVEVEIRYAHTNIVSIKKNGIEALGQDSNRDTKSGDADQSAKEDVTQKKADRSLLSIDNIKKFADEIEISAIKHIYDRQIQCNMDIAYEGMSGNYGLGIGRIIRQQYEESVITRMKAFASAASEARMGGCDMPVIINSGSGNQGIASSVPIIVYAREKNIPQETLYRSLVFASLLTTYQKEFIGRLSAFCGAVSASCASGAAITYMVGGSTKQIKDTIDNTLANIPGIICDGAKVSCAAKIASSIDAAMMAHFLAMNGQAYEAYTGILKEEAGETITCVGHIAKEGMRQTDKEIIKLMLTNG